MVYADESREYIFFRRMMRQSCKTESELPVDFACRGCEYHRPNWEYRFCEHTECPMMKGFKTFREEFYEDGGEGDGRLSS